MWVEGPSRLAPLALRCREVVNVDASTGMLAAFEALAAGADIQNARAVRATGWQQRASRGMLPWCPA